MRRERSLEVQDFGCMSQRRALQEWMLEWMNAEVEPSWAQAVFVLDRAAA